MFSAATALCRARLSNWERYAARDSLPILAIRLTVGMFFGLGIPTPRALGIDYNEANAGRIGRLANWRLDLSLTPP